MVQGILPRWVALVAALANYSLAIILILVHRSTFPSTTPFTGYTLFGTLAAIAIATQYNGKPLATSYTCFNELTSLSTVSLGSFLCGYNFQRLQHSSALSLPTATLPLLIFDLILQSGRILTMSLSDIEADREVRKFTLSAVLGKLDTLPCQ